MPSTIAWFLLFPIDGSRLTFRGVGWGRSRYGMLGGARGVRTFGLELRFKGHDYCHHQLKIPLLIKVEGAALLDDRSFLVGACSIWPCRSLKPTYVNQPTTRPAYYTTDKTCIPSSVRRILCLYWGVSEGKGTNNNTLISILIGS